MLESQTVIIDEGNKSGEKIMVYAIRVRSDFIFENHKLNKDAEPERIKIYSKNVRSNKLVIPH